MNYTRYSKIKFFATAIVCLLGATITRAQSSLTKEVSEEVAAEKGSLIRLVNPARKVNIKQWDQSKVKVTLEIGYDSATSKLTDQQWFENLGINIRPFSNRVDITKTAVQMSGTLFKKDLYTTQTYRTLPQKKGDHQEAERKAIITYKPVQNYARPVIKTMTILVPGGSKLNIESAYGDVVIGMNVEEAKLDISNGTLDALDIVDLELTASYVVANIGNVNKAEMELNSTTFRAVNIKELDIDSKTSTIEYENGNYLYLRSQNDHFVLDEINKIDGRKQYGSIKVDKLNSSCDIEGNNVDIKFKHIAPSATLIRINDKYADIRIPVKGLNNYFVDFNGNYSTVFAPFEKQVVKSDSVVAAKPSSEQFAVLEYSLKGNVKSTTPHAPLGEAAPRHFTGSAGSTKGTHTRIELTCHSCTVDFK